jgi:hypothetical protein
MAEAGERWPPVYDLEDLVNEIRRMARDERLERDFYEWRRDRSTLIPADVCQGDVVRLDSEVPVILEDGQPSVVEHPERHWMVIGNTCDLDRPIDHSRWTQLVPIESVGPLVEVTVSQLAATRRYTQARRFYLPPWSQESELRLNAANLLLPVAVDKRVLQGVTKVATLQARMSRGAWVLLNACLVRFLARDDGRYDA